MSRGRGWHGCRAGTYCNLQGLTEDGCEGQILGMGGVGEDP